MNSFSSFIKSAAGKETSLILYGSVLKNSTRPKMDFLAEMLFEVSNDSPLQDTVKNISKEWSFPQILRIVKDKPLTDDEKTLFSNWSEFFLNLVSFAESETLEQESIDFFLNLFFNMEKVASYIHEDESEIALTIKDAAQRLAVVLLEKLKDKTSHRSDLVARLTSLCFSNSAPVRSFYCRIIGAFPPETFSTEERDYIFGCILSKCAKSHNSLEVQSFRTVLSPLTEAEVRSVLLAIDNTDDEVRQKQLLALLNFERETDTFSSSLIDSIIQKATWPVSLTLLELCPAENLSSTVAQTFIYETVPRKKHEINCQLPDIYIRDQDKSKAIAGLAHLVELGGSEKEVLEALVSWPEESFPQEGGELLLKLNTACERRGFQTKKSLKPLVWLALVNRGMYSEIQEEVMDSAIRLANSPALEIISNQPLTPESTQLILQKFDEILVQSLSEEVLKFWTTVMKNSLEQQQSETQSS